MSSMKPDDEDDRSTNAARAERKRQESEHAISVVTGFLAVAMFLYVAVEKTISGDQSHIVQLFQVSKIYLPPDFVVMLFLVVHHIRLWMGVNFILVDNSIGAAITKAFRADQEIIQKKERRLRIALLLSVYLLILFLNGNFGLWGLVVVLCLQSLVLVLYNLLFFDAMFKENEKRAAHIFIAVGDGIIILFSILLMLYAVLNSVYPDYDAYAVTIMTMIFGALISVFVGECISLYWPSLLRLVRQLNKAIF